MTNINNLMIELLEKYNAEQKANGFIPTIDLLIEDLKEKKPKRDEYDDRLLSPEEQKL